MYLRFLLIISTCHFVHVLGDVFGIDFGSDFIKIGVLKYGSPLDVVTNYQSKRKTPSLVAFKGKERFFGTDAVQIMNRNPETSFYRFIQTLGRSIDHPEVESCRKSYNIDQKDEQILFHTDNVSLTAEEISAMLLEHIKEITENFTGRKIKDCVITGG